MKASLTGPFYLVLPPAAFTSDGNDPDGFFYSFSGGYLKGRGAIGACLLAPVNLPVGVEITGLEVRLNDNNASSHAWFDLYRINLETGSAQVIASVSSPTGTTGGVVPLVDSTVTYPVVSDMYAYQLCTCIWPDIYAYGARIGYRHSSFLPLVVKDY